MKSIATKLEIAGPKSSSHNDKHAIVQNNRWAKNGLDMGQDNPDVATQTKSHKTKNPQSHELCGFSMIMYWWAVLGSNQ